MVIKSILISIQNQISEDGLNVIMVSSNPMNNALTALLLVKPAINQLLNA